MATTLKRTGNLADSGQTILTYGQSGAGKTALIKTLPNPIILSAEGGLLSIQDADLPYIEIGSIGDLREAWSWLTSSEEAQKYQSIAIDSISEVAEVVLNAEKQSARDPRQAFGAMHEQMSEIIRAFRDIPNRHVYMTAKMEKAQDEMGRILYSPSMPGQKLGQALPHYFDEVFALRVERDADGNTQRALMTAGDSAWVAKDRSSRLDPWESADLGAIIAKIGGKA